MQKRMPDNSTLTVPVPDHKELKRGTLVSIIRQSGLDKREFEA
ncbi:MAG: type II toxin-antitoxin system HicA family toxin [Gammaproteobacteria bacterium]|nr:type II toxin-antitoxin system HicA family toxin [Gammaproteobacteria bacterium]